MQINTKLDEYNSIAKVGPLFLLCQPVKLVRVKSASELAGDGWKNALDGTAAAQAPYRPKMQHNRALLSAARWAGGGWAATGPCVPMVATWREEGARRSAKGGLHVDLGQ